MDWFDFVARFGLPTALLLLIFVGGGRFIAKSVWPWATKQVEEWQVERSQERKIYLEKLEEQRVAFLTALTAEREARSEERDKFLRAFSDHRLELATITRTQGEIQKTLQKMRRPGGGMT